MRHLPLILSTMVFASCVHSYKTSKDFTEEFEKRTNQKSDTLIVAHEECTGCLDLHIIHGGLTIPPDISKKLSMPSEEEITVCGNFPMDLIDMTAFNFDSKLSFKIIGKIIAVDTNNGVGNVPLFYVENWEKK